MFPIDMTENRPPAATADLRILATSDLHAHIHAWDYYSDQPSATLGLAKVAGLIAKARAGHSCTLLVDNGDFLEGSPLGDLVALVPGGALHPMIGAMNQLGYDAATLGNHEFSHGLEHLQTCLRDANFPVVSANILLKKAKLAARDRTLLAPWHLLTRTITDSSGHTRALRIGIIGFAPPQTIQWENHLLQGKLASRDILESAAAHIPALKAAGADIIIALSHSGIGAAEPSAGMENASVALAAVAGIDVLIAGHTHQLFPAPDFPGLPGVDPVHGTLWGKPAVMPGFYGSHLGVIDLTLTHTDGQWSITGHHVQVRPIARRNGAGRLVSLAESDATLELQNSHAHQATRVWAGQRIGHSTHALHSYFALISACPAVRIVAQAQADFVKRALLDTQYAGLPVLSAAAPFRAGGRGGPENYTCIPAGDIAMRNVADLYFHPNAIAALSMTGRDIAEWLERSASQFHQIHPDADDTDLIDNDFASFNFDSLEGVTYQIDVSNPARFDTRGTLRDHSAHRIRDVRFDGIPIAPDDRFVVATNSYRISSGAFAAVTATRVILSGPDVSRDILQRHIAAQTSLAAVGQANWSFAPMAGATVVIESAPAAVSHINELPHLRIEPLESRPNGFRRFRLHL